MSEQKDRKIVRGVLATPDKDDIRAGGDSGPPPAYERPEPTPPPPPPPSTPVKQQEK